MRFAQAYGFGIIQAVCHSRTYQKEIAYNIRGAGKLVDEKIPEVWAILEEVIKDKRVLLNRAPSLHRLSIQAFQPILIGGNAIQLHPLVCHGFNADFDGDQMSVHVPLGPEAQAEAKDIIASVKNLLRPGNGDPIVDPSQDMVMGCYWLTKIKQSAKGEGNFYSSSDDAILAHDFGKVDTRAKIKVLPDDLPKYKIFNGEIFETTVGRLMFNGILPDDFPYINEETGKKVLSGIVSRLIEKYGIDAVPDILDRIKEFGFRYATVSGISWGYHDLKLPEKKGEILAEAEKQAIEIKGQYQDGLLTDSERYNKIIEIWQGAKNKVEDLVPETMDKMGPVHDMVTSGARGSLNQLAQMTGMKGLMINPAGKIIDFPVRSSYKEGLGILEYFITTHGARKGEADTSLKTSKAGYLTRRLVDVSHDVVVAEEDCGDKEGIVVSRSRVESYGKKFSSRIFGRTLAASAGNLKRGIF